MTVDPLPIGPAEERDWNELALLVAASGLPEGGLRGHLETTLVARDRGRVVGSVALELYGPDAHTAFAKGAGTRRGRRNVSKES